MIPADFHPEATKEGIHRSPKGCSLNETMRLTPSGFSVNIQFGGMFIESCDVLDLHAVMKDNNAGKAPTGKSTINYDRTI